MPTCAKASILVNMQPSTNKDGVFGKNNCSNSSIWRNVEVWKKNILREEYSVNCETGRVTSRIIFGEKTNVGTYINRSYSYSKEGYLTSEENRVGSYYDKTYYANGQLASEERNSSTPNKLIKTFFGVDGTPLNADGYPNKLSSSDCFSRAGTEIIDFDELQAHQCGHPDKRYCLCSRPVKKSCSSSPDARVLDGIIQKINKKTDRSLFEKIYAEGFYCGERRYHPRTGSLLVEKPSNQYDTILKSRKSKASRR